MIFTVWGGHKATPLQFAPVGATFMVAQSGNNCKDDFPYFEPCQNILVNL